MGTRSFSKYVIAVAVSATVAVACSNSDEATPEEAFASRLVGTFERVSPVPAPDGSTAYLRQTLAFERSGSSNTVTQSLTTEAFFDEALTQQVLKYDSVGPCETVRKSSIPDGFEVDCTNESSMLTVYEADPGLLQGLGIDDCNLTAGVAQDVSNGCAAPTFQVSACVDQDVFALSDDGATFTWGDQTQDRCVRRTTDLEPAGFARVP